MPVLLIIFLAIVFGEVNALYLIDLLTIRSQLHSFHSIMMSDKYELLILKDMDVTYSGVRYNIFP
jgi:hypothetical protein